MTPEMGTDQVTAAFASTFMSTAADLVRAREDFSDWLAGLDVSDDVRSDLSIAFSELGSNAVAAVDDGDHELHVAGWRSGSELVFEVTNPVVKRPGPLTRWDLADPLRGGGRGLMIVRALTDAIEVRNNDGHLTVRCRTQVAPR